MKWNFKEMPASISAAEAAALQKKLFLELDLSTDPGEIKTVAGCDVSIRSGFACGAVCVFTYPGLSPVQAALHVEKVSFPYIPGLLSFREAPVLLKAAEKLTEPPDLFLFDGQGISHPRKMGLASHMGVVLRKPAVGCAKTRLCGSYDEPGRERGARSALYGEGGEIIGCVLRTRSGVSPVFVSQGNMISLEKAVGIIMSCTGKYRLPEPLREAHSAAGGKLRSFF